MAGTIDNTTRTAHLLALMKKGDDGFNARDYASVDTVHHPDLLGSALAKEWFENWVTKRLANDRDAEDGIAVLRESYDEVRAQ